MSIPLLITNGTNSGKGTSSGSMASGGTFAAGHVGFIFIRIPTAETLPTTTSQTPRYIAASDSGWTAVTGSPWSQNNNKLYAFWHRYSGVAAQDTPAWGLTSANLNWCRIDLNGVTLSDPPFEALGTGTNTTANPTLGAITTLGDNRLIVGVLAENIDSNSNQISGFTNANLANPSTTTGPQSFYNAGSGVTPGGLAVYYGGKAATGSTGNTTSTCSAAGWEYIHFAVKEQSVFTFVADSTGQTLATASGNSATSARTVIATNGGAIASGPSVTTIFWAVHGASGVATAGGGIVSYSSGAQNLDLTAAASGILAAAGGTNVLLSVDLGVTNGGALANGGISSFALGINSSSGNATASSTRTTYSAFVSSLSPSLYWRMEDASGNYTDSSGHGYDGAPTGVVFYHQGSLLAANPSEYSMGQWGALAASISGVRASSLKPFTVGSKITVAAWIEPINDVPGSLVTVFSGSGSGGSGAGMPHPTWEYGQTNAGFIDTLRFYPTVNTFPVGWVDFVFPNPIAIWSIHHLAATFDDTTGMASCYLDGQLVSTKGPDGDYGGALHFDTGADPGYFQIGYRGSVGGGASAGESFSGFYDEVVVLPTILSAAQIKRLYDLGRTNTFINLEMVGADGDANASGGTVTYNTGIALTASNGTATASGGTTTFVKSYDFTATSGSATATGNVVTYVEGATPVTVTADSTGQTLAIAGGDTVLYYKSVVVIADSAGQTQATAGGPNVVTTFSTYSMGGDSIAGGGSAIYGQPPLISSGGNAVTGGTELAVTIEASFDTGDAAAGGGTATYNAGIALTASNGDSIAGGGTVTYAAGLIILTASNGDSIAGGGTVTLAQTVAATTGAATATGGDVTYTPGQVYSFTSTNGNATGDSGTVTFALTVVAVTGVAAATGGAVTFGQVYSFTSTNGNVTASGGTAIYAVANIASSGNATAAGGMVIGDFGQKFPSTRPGPDYLILDSGKVNELNLDENQNGSLILTTRTTSPGLNTRTTSPALTVRTTYLTLNVNHSTGVILDENHTGHLTLSVRETSPGLNAPDKELILNG